MTLAYYQHRSNANFFLLFQTKQLARRGLPLDFAWIGVCGLGLSLGKRRQSRRCVAGESPVQGRVSNPP